MFHVIPFFGAILSLQDAAIFSERLAELYFNSGRERFAHAYLLEALEMWNAIAMDLKVKHLRERYPDVLGHVVLTDNKLVSVPDSTTDSFLHQSSTQSLTSSFSQADSRELSSVVSDSSHVKSGRGINFSWMANTDGPLQRALGRNLSLAKESITSSVVLDVLRSVIRNEDVDEMLSCFMSELLVRTGALPPVLGLTTRFY